MTERRRFFPPLLVKGATIGAVMLRLLILISQVEDVVGERVKTRATAAARIAESWGGQQTTAGVLLAIPVETTRVIYGDTTRVERRMLYVLPDTLDVKASAEPSSRTVGMYTSSVYLANVTVSGQFVARDFQQPKSIGELKWAEARLLILNSESRSLRAVDGLQIGAETAAISADSYAGMAGGSAA